MTLAVDAPVTTFAKIMEHPNQHTEEENDVPRWIRIFGTVSGFLAIIMGFMSSIGIILLCWLCLICGLWQIISGFIVVCCEIPAACLLKKLRSIADDEPYWKKALAYIGLSIPPIILSPSLSSLVGSVLIFAIGIIYAMTPSKRKPQLYIINIKTAVDNLGKDTKKEGIFI